MAKKITEKIKNPEKEKTKSSPPSPAEGEAKLAKKMETPPLLRGMKDILPQDAPLWRWVRKTAEHFADVFQFGFIETPILEAARLFEHPLGRDSDVVEKQMYIFQDLDGDRLALRPENTAGMVRAYITHGMWNQPQPVKLWYWGQFFRHERPQSGRFREFHQFGFEMFGDPEPVADALCILVSMRSLEALAIPVSARINSIGCAACRPQYREALLQHYRVKRHLICETCKRRMQKNPLRLLDCKEEQCQSVKASAPQSVDFLCDDCKAHLMRVLEYVDEFGIAYTLDHTLVRGFDYYTRTVFEIVAAEAVEGSQIVFGGGGRFDGLVEQLGGHPTPAVGFAHGIERIVSYLRDKNITPPPAYVPQVFVAQLGEAARRGAIVLFEKLRNAGFRVVESFSKTSLRAQLEVANRLRVPVSVILGQKELLEGTAMLRDMDSGVQEVVPMGKLESMISRKLEHLPAVIVPVTPDDPHERRREHDTISAQELEAGDALGAPGDAEEPIPPVEDIPEGGEQTSFPDVPDAGFPAGTEEI